MKKAIYYTTTVISFINVCLFYSVKPIWFHLNQMIDGNLIWTKLIFGLFIIIFLALLFGVIKSKEFKIKHIFVSIPILFFLGLNIYMTSISGYDKNMIIKNIFPLTLILTIVFFLITLQAKNKLNSFFIGLSTINTHMTTFIRQLNLQPAKITSGPNFSYVGNELVVTWTTNVKSTGFAEYGQVNNLKRAASSENGMFASDTTHFKVILTNIKDGDVLRVGSQKIKAHYQTKIVFGNTVYSDFINYEDTRDKPILSFYILSDTHGRKDIFDKYLNADDYDFVIFNGDMFSSIDTEKQIVSEFLTPITSNKVKPFYFARGNHETRGACSAMLDDYIALEGKRYYYTFTYGSTFFIVLDTGEDKGDGHVEYFGLADYAAYRKEQTAWLESVAAAKEYEDYEHIIAVSHIPLLKDEIFPYKGKWISLLNEISADVLLCGHTHKAEIVKTDNIPIVIGGGYDNSNRGYEAIKVTAGETILFEIITEDGDVIESYKIG